ncbi:MAG: FAD-dependent oxidoreductase [Syntrophobacteraceae bacterium]|jgi:predicted NAD/FAD-binding protein|nr:FAD-dependent oxidoreductase [Syntrophobacteraceae bacterium]
MRIAVVGTGIAGMVAAHLLSDGNEMVVFEANDYVGGHTHTIDVSTDGATCAVDTGFIVFNERTYPNFVTLMKRLGVAWKPSNMSFSVQCEETGLEYSPSTLGSLFAQKRNLFRPAFHRMLWDVFRFKRESRDLLYGDDYSLTLREYLHGRGYSRAFIQHFIIPMGEAIWSADPARFDEFPAAYFVKFFNNHGILNLRDQPRWLVIRGGSRSYVEPMTRPYRHSIRVGCPVERIRRYPDRVEVRSRGGGVEQFDRVVIASHSDQALAMLEDPSDAERRILDAIPYQENLASLHTDASILPRRRAAWASWNYHIPRTGPGRVSVTYNMNMLQGLDCADNFCVSLNSARPIRPDKVIESMVYHHPVYTPRGFVMQEGHDAVNGVNRTYFCGAYWGYGFHEDGVNSALRVCRHFNRGL